MIGTSRFLRFLPRRLRGRISTLVAGIDLLDVEIASRLKLRWPYHVVRPKNKMVAEDAIPHTRGKDILFPGRLGLAPKRLRMILHHLDVDLVNVIVILVTEDKGY